MQDTTSTITPAQAATWFEIPAPDLAQSQAFYEAMLGRHLRRETMGPHTLAVFPYQDGGAGGCLLQGADMPAPSQGGALVYLDCNPSIDSALARVADAGGQVVTPRTALPPGMGFFAHIVDVADLQRQGVPIDGAAGVGYRLGAGFELPPLMFSTGEARALVAATRLAQAWLDPEMARDAETALSKVLSALPASTRAAAESLALYAPVVSPDPEIARHLQDLRQAVQVRRRVAFAYRDLAGRHSARTVRPLGCFCWGAVWTLAAWCEKRQAFRNFRLDRITALQVSNSVFRDEPGRTLADFLRAQQP